MKKELADYLNKETECGATFVHDMIDNSTSFEDGDGTCDKNPFCDVCSNPMTKYGHKKNKGLCPTCIDAIN